MEINKQIKSLKDNSLLSWILQIVVGLVFLSSAILKYISIDVFDLYIYEHNLFDLPITETLTRLLIAVELTLGLMFVFRLQIRKAYYFALFMLVAFTIYLLLLPYIFNVDITNCHCFGEKVVLNRTQSIIKNLILIVLIFPIQYDFKEWKHSLRITIGLFLLAFIVLMSINAPNYIYKLVHKDKIQIDNELYYTALKNQNKEAEYSEGKQIICMYSTHCGYCKKSAKKLSLIFERKHQDVNRMKAIFWSSQSEEAINHFFEEQSIAPIPYTTFTVDTFLNITQGNMPIILFSDNGKIVKASEYISLQEEDIENFLENQ